MDSIEIDSILCFVGIEFSSDCWLLCDDLVSYELTWQKHFVFFNCFVVFYLETVMWHLDGVHDVCPYSISEKFKHFLWYSSWILLLKFHIQIYGDKLCRLFVVFSINLANNGYKWEMQVMENAINVCICNRSTRLASSKEKLFMMYETVLTFENNFRLELKLQQSQVFLLFSTAYTIQHSAFKLLF